MIGYLYIIWSKHFDVDGPDTLYKFGSTNNIARRLRDSCYNTAFKYPCQYKRYYELTVADDKSLRDTERGIIAALKAGGFYAAETNGREMFSIKFSALVKHIETALDREGIEYRAISPETRPLGVRPPLIKITKLPDFARIRRLMRVR